MYVRRAALDDVGGFDAGTFGRGYGEEVDFCQRARRRGWRHMLACDCFVYHRGEVSFGADAARDARVRAVLAERHPDYERDVNNWVRAGLADPARFALTAELMRRSGLPTVLMISHDLGGGVARHVTELGARLAGTAHVLELTPGRGGMRLGVPGLAGHPRLVVPAGAVAGLVRWLRHVGIARVHVHHAMGYGPELRELIRALGVPFDLTVHDYYLLCPQVNLLPRPDAQYCGEPEARACHACLAEAPAFGARDIHSWRRAHGWLFQDAARVICPSADAAARVARLGVRVPVVTAPHEVMTGPWVVSAPPLGARGRLRVALLGVLAERKGLAIVTAVLAAAPEWVEFVLIGHPEEELPPALAARLQVTGRYEEDALAGLLARVKPHVAWFPAQWPETYSYTLSAALAAGLPVVAADIGAFPERLRGRPLSWTVSPADGTRAWLDAFATARAALASGRAARAARPVQGVDFYARDYTAPIRKAPLDRKTVRATMRGGRRARRVLLVPERLENGVMSPCAYIRLLQPLDHLGMSGGLEIEIGEAADVAAARADMVLTQRHALADVAAAERLADACRATGARLVYDLDDDLLRAHTTHPEAARITAGAPVVARMLALADEVWVPTPALAARLGRTRRRPRVVENGLDERIFWPPPPPVPPEGPLRLLYMGTATHGADFDMIAPALERLVTTFGARVAVDVIGVRPGALPDWAQRVAPPAGRTASYPAFADWLSRAPRWHIGLAPLVDTEFNRAKSAIKAMDYAALGMPTVASSVGVYDTAVRAGETGLIVANDPDAWFDALAGLVRDPVRRARMARAARARFEDTFCLAAQVPARLAALGL
jgi:glycosyltransferase involved in cell wall biosynthesis